MIKKFCEKCLKDMECNYNEGKVSEVIDDKTITYLKKYYQCRECNQIIYDDLIDYNIEAANNELRKITKLITVDEINQILKKYNIGKKPLSYILGLGEVTITRYLDGQNPTKENSDLLKAILDNPNLYELYLITNKDKITDIAYKKSLGKTKQLQLLDSHSKLYTVALYIIDKIGETTPLALQKLLYFANGFSNKILNKCLFTDTPEAWKYGPVYRNIYECFSYYKGNNIDYSELLKDYNFNLNDDEKEYIDQIILLFGCYSGNILREMTHLTEPWLEARVGLNPDDVSNRVIDEDVINKYFDKMCEKYHIETKEDIKNYSSNIFNEALNNIKNNLISYK